MGKYPELHSNLSSANHLEDHSVTLLVNGLNPGSRSEDLIKSATCGPNILPGLNQPGPLFRSYILIPNRLTQ